MVSKPFIIAPEAARTDYSDFIRRTMNWQSETSFAQVLEMQPEVKSQTTGASTQGKTDDAGQTSARPRGIELDQRSLATLQQISRTSPSSTGPQITPPNIPQNGPQNGPKTASATENAAERLGSLSSQFESGNKDSAAIGYDRNGGTSYGKYQISSRQGSFEKFLNFLGKSAPDLEERLRTAGPANTNSRQGATPNEWKTIAAEQPERFERLQEDFIRSSHYDLAEKEIKNILGTEELSRTLQEVIWSTAVQHGPNGAKNIFARAVQSLGDKKAADPKSLITEIYKIRGRQFSSSTSEVQAAVRQRFDTERSHALAMLKSEITIA